MSKDGPAPLLPMQNLLPPSMRHFANGIIYGLHFIDKINTKGSRDRRVLVVSPVAIIQATEKGGITRSLTWDQITKIGCDGMKMHIQATDDKRDWLFIWVDDERNTHEDNEMKSLISTCVRPFRELTISNSMRRTDGSPPKIKMNSKEVPLLDSVKSNTIPKPIPKPVLRSGSSPRSERVVSDDQNGSFINSSLGSNWKKNDVRGSIDTIEHNLSKAWRRDQSHNTPADNFRNYPENSHTNHQGYSNDSSQSPLNQQQSDGRYLSQSDPNQLTGRSSLSRELNNQKIPCGQLSDQEKVKHCCSCTCYLPTGEVITSTDGNVDGTSTPVVGLDDMIDQRVEDIQPSGSVKPAAEIGHSNNNERSPQLGILSSLSEQERLLNYLTDHQSSTNSNLLHSTQTRDVSSQPTPTTSQQFGMSSPLKLGDPDENVFNNLVGSPLTREPGKGIQFDTFMKMREHGDDDGFGESSPHVKVSFAGYSKISNPTSPSVGDDDQYHKLHVNYLGSMTASFDYNKSPLAAATPTEFRSDGVVSPSGIRELGNFEAAVLTPRKEDLLLNSNNNNNRKKKETSIQSSPTSKVNMNGYGDHLSQILEMARLGIDVRHLLYSQS